MQKTNILYIHGYGGTGNSRTAQALKTYLPENFTVFSPCFPLNPTESIELAQKIIQTEKINLVVASSLGAFTALQLRDVPKIVINPCLYPSKELPKRVEIPKDIVQNLTEFEKRTFENISEKDKNYTFGVFSTDDELFSYIDEFAKHYPNFQEMKDVHRISVENVKKVIAPIVQEIKIKLVK
jgi:predicted esterase YcpF (UPF0227 family)